MTFINISMCLLIVVGIVLVAQPKFIFGQVGYSIDPESTERQKYVLGVCLALGSSCITGFYRLLQIQCKDIPMSYFMLWSGIAKMIIGLLCPVFGLPNNLNDLPRFAEHLGVLSLAASASMMGMLFMQTAVAVSNNGVLVSVTRSMEIVMALVVDMITTSQNYHDTSVWYKILGGIVVLGCIICISISDILQDRVSRLCGRTRDGYALLDDEDHRISEEAPVNIVTTNYGTSEPSGWNRSGWNVLDETGLTRRQELNTPDA